MKITGLPARVAVALTDIVALVDAAGGVPATWKATIAQIRSALMPVVLSGADVSGVLPLASVASPTTTGLVKVSAGSWVTVAATLVDADVSGTAAIAGTKVAPDFGAQNVVTTGIAKLGGATVSATGTIRLSDACSINSITGGVDRPMISHSGGTVIVGDASNIAVIINRANAAGQMFNQVNGNNHLTINPAGIQIGSSTFDLGGGSVGVMGWTNATTAPTTNPTTGGIMFAAAGAGKWRGPSGTVTTFGVADPHCPRCGRDFAIEHQNDTLGEHLAVCLPCLIDALQAAGISAAGFTITDKRGTTKAQWDAEHANAKAREAAAVAADAANKVKP